MSTDIVRVREVGGSNPLAPTFTHPRPHIYPIPEPMDMVRKYLALAETDVAAAHRIASPVANWRL